jgi:hypothetical protein
MRSQQTVVWSRDDEGVYGQTAEEIASKLSADLIKTDTRPSADRVLYVSPPAKIEDEDVLDLQRRVAETGGEFSYGIITGRTPESARTLFERGHRGFDHSTDRDETVDHAMLLRKVDKDLFSYDDETSVFTRDECTTESLLDVSGSAESLSMVINGRSIHSYLTGGYLCGAPSTPSVHDFPGEQPPCITEDGGVDCPHEEDNELLMADSLDIPHVFYSSCTSMYPNSLTEPPVNVGLSLLENATSLIGGYRTKSGKAHEVALHYALFRSGYSAGERSYILNSNAKRIGLEAYPYTVFGTPEARVTRPTTQSFTVQQGDDDSQYEVSAIDTHLIEFTVDIEDPSNCYVRNLTDTHADAPLFYTVVSIGSETTVLVYSWGRIVADQLNFEVSTQPYRVGDRRLVRQALTGADQLDELGFLDGKARGQIENLRNQLRSLVDDVESERYRLNGYRQTSETIDRLLDAVDTVQDRLVWIFSTRGPGHLSEEYGERVIDQSAEVSDRPCPNCERPLFVRRESTPDRATVRERGTCPHCAKVFNAPRHGNVTNFPTVDIYGNGTNKTVEVTFTNHRDVPMRVSIFPWIHHDDDGFRGRDALSPKRVDERLYPGESVTTRHTLDSSELITDDYMIYGYIIGNLNMYLGINRCMIE